MDSHVAFGSHSHLVKPITALLKTCQALNEKYHESQDQNIQTLLNLIPSIDPTKIDTILSDIKASNFKAQLQTNGYDCNIDQSIFSRYPFIEKYTEFQSVVIFLYIILTFLYPAGDQDFKFILNLLQKTQRSQMSVVHDFCFELVLSAVLSAKNQSELYEILLNYILNISSISPTSFPILITLFKLVSQSGNETELILLQHTIGHMLDCDFSCIQDIDIALLVEPLYNSIMNFNKNSILVLGKATKQGKPSRNMMEFIHKFYKKIDQFITDHSSGDQFVVGEDKLFFIKDSPKIPKHNFEYYNKPTFKFFPLPLNDIITPGDFPKLISDEVFNLSIIIADFLQHASKDVVFDFIAQFSIHLETNENFFEFCASFLTIVNHLTDSTTAVTVVELFSQTLLFSPHRTIFQSDTYDKRLNYLRNRAFDFIIATDPRNISIMLNSAQRYPLLLSEHLLRVISKFESFSPIIFAEEPIRTILSYSLLDLQASENSDLNNVRSVNFYFIHDILTQENSVDLLFSSPLFCASFFQFIFEPGLDIFIISTFSKSMTLMNCEKGNKYIQDIVKFFLELLHSCTQRVREGKEIYNQLFCNIIKFILIGLQYNLGLVPHFSSILNVLLNYAKNYPTAEVVQYLLKLIHIINLKTELWELTPRQYSILFSTIRQIYGDEPDNTIVQQIFAIMENASFVYSRDHILIQCPSLLPLLFAIHGKSQNNVKLISTFIQLCNFSMSNSVAMHDGYIDYLIIEYLSKNEDHCYVNFRDKSIEFKFNRSEVLPMMLELLGLIIKAKTSFAIAHSLVNLLNATQDESINKFIANILLNGQSEYGKISNIPLDSSNPVIQLDGVDWNHLKNQFSLDFDLYLDEKIMKRFKQTLTIFEIFDKNNKFSIILKNTSILAIYETSKETITTFLFRNIFQTEFGHYSICAISNKDQLKFYNYRNKEKLSDSSMDLLAFTNPITIRIGGSDFVSHTKKHPLYGNIFGFKLFDIRLSDEDTILLNESPSHFLTKPLFTANIIKSETIKSFKIPETPSITVNLLPTFHRVIHLLDYFSEPSILEKVLNLEKTDVALDIILNALSKRPDIQNFHDLIDRLEIIALRDLRYSTYLSLYRIMQTIDDVINKFDWFDKLIMNFTIWSKSEHFYDILSHWTINVKPNSKFFKAKNFFANLLSQFMKTYSQSNEQKETKTIQQFYRFMLKIARLNFNEQSFDVLISCILLCTNSSNLWDLMQILLPVSKSEIALSNMNEKKLSNLNCVFKFQNINLLVISTCCIHNLSSHISEYSMLTVSYFLLNYNRIPEYVDKLLDKLNSYPRLLSLLTILSIHTDKASQLVDKIQENMLSSKPTLYMIVKEDYWYLWPIMLMLNVSESKCEILCKFIATCLTMTDISDKIDKVLKEAFALMFRMSFFIPKYDMIVRVLHNICSFYTNNDVPIPEIVVEYCFIFFFLHIPQTLHSPPLLQLVAKSPFPKSELRKSSYYYNKFNIIELESLLHVDFLKFDLQCRVSLTEDMKLVDKFYYRIYKKFKAPKNPLFDIKLMIYFINRDSLDPATQKSMAQNLTNIFESLKSYVINDICDTLVIIQKEIQSLIDNCKELVNNMQNFDPNQIEKVYHLDASQSNLINSAKNSSADSGKPQSLVRSNLLCASYCPFRYKRKRLVKFSQPVRRVVQSKQKTPRRRGKIARSHSISESSLQLQLTSSSNSPTKHFSILHSFSCLMINQTSQTKFTLNIYNDRFQFVMGDSNSEKFKLKDIMANTVKFLFTRKIGSNNGYELYTNDSKSYLFVMKPNEFQLSSNIIKQMHFINAQSVRISNEDLGLNEITEKWLNWNLSNFEYLMILNIYSGRSFNDYNAYPVMPPIISDFNNISSEIYPSSLKNMINPTIPIDNIKDSFVDHLMVPADFYFDSSILKQQLPTWAKSKYEFIYLSRKKLEKMDITWFINRIFGSSKSSDNPNSKLFTRPHTVRNEEQFQQPKQHVFETDKAIAAILPSITSTEHYSFWIIFENKSIYIAKLTNEKISIKPTIQLECEDPIFYYSTNHIFAYSLSKALLYFLASPSNITEISLYTENPVFSMLDDTVIFCRDDSIIYKLNLNADSQQVTKFWYSDSKVTAIGTSNIFKTVAFATIDGYIHVHDLKNCEEITKVNTGCQINQIVITNNWGFIVGCSEDMIFILNANGEQITSYKTTNVIDNIYSFSIVSGFDFIAFATSDNTVGYFEALYPENWTKLRKFESPIKTVAYDSFRRSFVVVEKCGNIIIIPQNITV